MRAPTRFNQIDLYRKAGKAVKPLYGKTRQIKHRPVDKVPLDTIPQMFDKLSGPIADYITGEREKKDRENMQKALMAYRSGLPGQKERIDLSEQEIMDKYARPAKDAVIGGPMDIDETSDDIERRADDAWFNALPDIDDQGRFTQGKRLEGIDAAVAAAGDKPGPVTQKMLNALMLSDMDRKQVAAMEQKTAERDQGYALAKIREKPGPDTRTPLEKNLAALGLFPGSEEFNSAMKKGIEKMPPRPYDTTAGIKDANELAFRRKALRDAKTPEEKARAKQRLDDFDLILSKSFETIRGKASAQASGVQAVKASGSAFESLNKINLNMGNLDDAIAALRKGARTGAIDQYLPNIRASSVELRNIQNRLGLDVIGAVTFGALSKGELDLALETALPTSLDEPKLLAWLEKRKEGQRKLANYYSRAASYLGTPGNTVATWVDLQTAEKKARENADAAAAPSGVTKRLEFDAKGNPVL